MALLFWDASALVKRYTPETGSDTVQAIFGSSAAHEMASTAWGYAETYSILLRRLNGGLLDLPAFSTAVTALQAEVVNGPEFGLLPVADAAVFASIYQMRQHNLNATDAAILTALLEIAPPLAQDSPICVMIAADRRLLRAAEAEGLRSLNPELFAAADVPEFLARL